MNGKVCIYICLFTYTHVSITIMMSYGFTCKNSITIVSIVHGPPFGSETLGFGVRALPSGACDINGVCRRGLEVHLLHRIFKIFLHFCAMFCFLFWILEHIRNCIFHWLVILCILPPSLWWCGEVQRWWVSRFRTSPGRRERVGCARMEGSETDRQDTARGVVGVQQVCQCNMEQIQGVLMSKDLVLMS